MNKKNGPIRLLIAEDSATQAEQLRFLLEERGFEVMVAANGRIALDMIRQGPPALVISDIVMPELDGYGLCRAIKSDDKLKLIPVILVTTLSDSEDVIRGLDCGADNFIRKPYDEKYLLSRIDYLLMNLELRKNQRMQMALEINLGGRKHLITAERQQILDLLVSTYEQAVHVNAELKDREKDLAHSNQVLQGLNRIAAGLNGVVSERAVAETALQHAMELPGVQAGWIFLREGERGFRLAGAMGLPPALRGETAFDGDCACRRKLLSGELDSVTNILDCERLAKAPGETRGLCCHASVPLWLGPDRLLGVMNLVGLGRGMFNEDQLKVLYSVGNQVAVALERARLHGHLEQMVEERTSELRASEARLRTIIEAEPECVKVVDADGGIEQMNAAGLAMLDADSLEQVRGRKVIDFVSPEWREAYRAFTDGVLNGSTGAFEFEVTSLKGRRFWLDTHAVPLPEAPDGRPQMLAIARDVTGHKQAEAKLKLFRTLLDQSSDAIEVLDPATLRFLDINETECRVLGYSREELLAMHVSDIDPTIDSDAIKTVEAQLRQSGNAQFETVHRRKDGSTFPVEVSATIIEFDKPYLLSIARDITQRRANEAKIKRLNRIYAVLSGINTTIVRVREEGELLSEACRIAVEHGQFRFAWIGKLDADTRQVTPVAQAGHDGGYLAQIDLVARENIPGSCALTAQALAEAKPAVCNDIAGDARMAALRSAALDRGYRSVVVFPLKLEQRPWGVFALYATETDAFDEAEMKLLTEMSGDISYALDNLRLESRRKQAEAALLQLNESLEQRVAERTADLERARREADAANRAKSAFLATMSHEIRTPMNGVIGMVDVLAQSKLSEHQIGLVRTIRESANSLLGIIDDILDFSKIEAGRLVLEQAPASVVDLVEGVCNSLAPVAAGKRVELSLFIAPDIPERVLADDMRLRQVLYNLIGNAIKFSAGQPGRPGRVSVRAELAGKSPLRLTFRVIDNGIGMTPETVNALFSPFTQGEISTTRRFGGTGLGLAICRRLVDLMQGEIGVQSALGQGSTFTVTLPFEVPAEQPVRTLPDLAGLDCIVFEGPYLAAQDMRAYLEHAGARVHIEHDAAAAAGIAAGLAGPVVVILEAEHGMEPAAAHGRLAGMANVRYLLITRGRRRRARVESADTVILDGDVLRRQALLRAVAVAAGRASPETFHESPLEPVGGEEPPPTVAEARAQGRLILVAEDDEVNQKVILQQLALLGYAAEIAGNGAEALRLWRDGDYGLLLTDLHMPEMDGYTLAETIRREVTGRRRKPIIALTANALRGEAGHAHAAGIDEYLTKPVPLAALQAALHKWLPQRAEAAVPAEPAAGDGPAGASVDVTVLKALVGDDAATIREFLTDYLAAARRQAEEMRAAVVAGDAKQAGAVAHKLKSSSRAVGALALGDLCAELENLGKTGDTAAMALGMAGFDAALAEVEAEIGRIMAE